MNYHRFLFFIDFFIIILINICSLSLSKTSSIIPLYKIVLTENISHLEINALFNFRLNIKGNGIIFDDNSDVNIIPMNIMQDIYNFYRLSYDDILAKIEKLENNYTEFTIVHSLENLETIHFVLKDIGITLPLKQLFVLKDENINLFSFRFLSKENEDNIIFGKDLIELMKINFYDDKPNFEINNNEFISKIEDE